MRLEVEAVDRLDGYNTMEDIQNANSITELELEGKKGLALGLLRVSKIRSEMDIQEAVKYFNLASTAAVIIKRLWCILGHDAENIQHVGSVVNDENSAKSLINIVIGVKCLDVADKYRKVLVREHGMQYHGETMVDQRIFCKNVVNECTCRCYIYFVVYGSKQWNDHMNMLDYCNTFQRAAKAYNKWKHIVEKDISAHLVQEGLIEAPYSVNKRGRKKRI